MNINDLSYANIDSIPVTYDWYNEDGDAYEVYEAIPRDEDTTELGISCESCGEEVIIVEGNLSHANLTDCDDIGVSEEDEQSLRYRTSWDGESGPEHGLEGPMMNYYYPLDCYDFDPQQAAIALVNLPVCVVHFADTDAQDGAYALALTGGGMDLSWEICEAFIRLGSYPPVHFCDLPLMADKKATELNLSIIGACRKSLHAQQGRLQRTLESLTSLEGRLA